MKKYIIPLFTLLFFVMPIVVNSVSAASLKFDSTTVTATNGQLFELQVIVDPGSENITSVDAYVLFPSNLFKINKVTPGTYFPTVTNSIQSTKVYIAGLVDDPATSKTGTGTVATISFQAIADGTGTISYDCREGASDGSKVIKNDINATNIIVCGQNGSAVVTVGTGGGGSVSPTSGPVPTSSGGGGSTPPVQTLPQSGVVDSILKFSVPGAALLVVGLAMRLLL